MDAGPAILFLQVSLFPVEGRWKWGWECAQPLKTTWWRLMLRMGLPKGFFCSVALLLPLFRDAQSGCLCEVSPFRATIEKAVLGQAMGFLPRGIGCGFLGRCESKESPHQWLWAQWGSIPGCVTHSASQHVWISTPCQLLKLAVNRKRGKIRNGGSEIVEVNESWPLYTCCSPSWVSSGMLKPLVP